MARKVDYQKREDIAEAAFELIRAQGVNNTSMSSIAKALNMKRPTLYWYFKDLNAIFEAVLAKILFELAIFIEERMQGVTHPIDRLYAHARAVDAFFIDREDTIPCLFGLWAIGGTLNADGALQLTQAYAQPRRQKFIDDIQEGIDAGTIAPCNATAVVYLVGATIDGILAQRVAYQRGTFPPVHETLWTLFLEPLKRTST